MSDKAENLMIVETNDDVISINQRKKLGETQKQYPNLEIIIGGKDVNPEKSVPVSIDMAEMENTKNSIFDAATETIMGKRIDKLEKPRRFPFPFVTFILGMMVSAFIWLMLSGYIVP